jgi:glucose-6-phosphate isomerase
MRESHIATQPAMFTVVHGQWRLDPDADHIVRSLSAMRGQYAHADAFEEALQRGDVPVYEVHEIRRPPAPGELCAGLSIVHPGRVANEYFMTKGHFHARLDAAEVYYCLHGHGMMVMETPQGEWAVEELRPGSVLYVPPRWAHRSVNVGSEDLVTFFVYPSDAGHDYGTIEAQGFRKIIIEREGRPAVIDNPRWRHGEALQG